MQNPFTTTFSKIPDNSYIPTEQVAEIIENFSYATPSESVFKITGVRGSGKTVLLAKVEKEILSNESLKRDWLLYRLSPARDMLQQLAAFLYQEDFMKKKKKSLSLNFSANVLGTGAGIGVSSTEREDLFDVGPELDSMIKLVMTQKKKILISIDEVSRTSDMIIFASEFGKWLRAGYPVYLVCTGLYENIEQLSNVKNLTFFRRATTVKTSPLNYIRMAEMYKNKLSVPLDTAKRLASITKGYPYAFQQLGVLYFKKGTAESEEEILELLRSELFSYAYEKIWEELSTEDRELILLLSDQREYKRAEVLQRMVKPANYSVYRDRLLRKGLITSRQGYISLTLPFFGEYLKEYCSE